MLSWPDGAAGLALASAVAAGPGRLATSIESVTIAVAGCGGCATNGPGPRAISSAHATSGGAIGRGGLL